MSSKEILKNELLKVNQELAMEKANDGWWNLYMEERKKTLEKLIKELDNK